ncbi:MAG: prepilin peptidase [Candidatus Aenigmatarchaeota archaeon]
MINMLEIFSFLTLLFGISLAAAFDVKITPTEIPDELTHALIALGILFSSLESLIQFNFQILINSLIYGISFLAFGFLLYKLGQWGGGDAKVLASIGFFSPLISNLLNQPLAEFAFTYLINLFLLGAVYMIFYSIVLALINRKIISNFLKNAKSSSKIIVFSFLLLFSVTFFINSQLFKIYKIPFELASIIFNSLLICFLTICLFLLWVFVKSVENVAFKKRIPISKLKVGDVLLESKVWEGLTEEEVKRIKRSGKKFVWIKEGVRFAPSFPLALLFTFYYGNVLFSFFKFI